jgi:O-methyltransferase
MKLTYVKVVCALIVFKVIKFLKLDNIFINLGILSKYLKVHQLNDIKHEFLTPWATYAPWNNDQDFKYIFNIIRHHTLVDLYRCYQLWLNLAEAAKSGSGDILEVGVWRGGSSALLGYRAKQLGINAKVYLADTFEGVVKAGSGDTSYHGGEHSDTSQEIVESLLKKSEVTNYEVLVGIFPDDLNKEISKRFIFCHIDVDTYDSAQGVVDWVLPKLNSQGIIIFDDYGFYNCTGVTRYVNELKTRNDLIVQYNLSGQAIVIKK